ncbi:hypothetical protein [Paenibacillus ihuae]|uniref:hypothetical protein n=1 Tax=Paenibacillus ihuae TaxID=1232431 RepID=UPI0006D5314E|nr:hypothetical protein [Paenibacillus ihuae]
MGLFAFLAIIFLVIVFNKFLLWWIKATLVAYYSVISYFFITIRNKIDRDYENLLPVPDAYWAKNSSWFNTMQSLLFFPMLIILLFVYYKWFTGVRSKQAEFWVILSCIPTVITILFFAFMFSFSYGYRP